MVDEDDDDDDDDDDLDLFGSDDEDAETLRIKQERIDAYAAKKSKKPALIAKSSILLDVKPVRVYLLSGSFREISYVCSCTTKISGTT